MKSATGSRASQNGVRKAAPKKSSVAGKVKTSGKSTSRENRSSEDETAFRELFLHGIKDIYWAEKALTKALPKMIKKAAHRELADALNSHLEETKGQVEKLEEVFAALGEKAQAKKCDGMSGLIEEGEGMMSETKGMVRDAAIIAAAQKVEHYEIASYGTLVAWGKLLGENEAVSLLEEILEEEKDADAKLTSIAETSINIEAMDKGEEDDESDTNVMTKKRSRR